jgi:hypothetical protein
MPSSGMLRCVDLVRTDASEEHITYISRLTRIGELGTTFAVTRLLVTANAVPSLPIHFTLIMEVIRSSETSILTRATLNNIPEDGILHSHCR